MKQIRGEGGEKGRDGRRKKGEERRSEEREKVGTGDQVRVSGRRLGAR